MKKVASFTLRHGVLARFHLSFTVWLWLSLARCIGGSLYFYPQITQISQIQDDDSNGFRGAERHFSGKTRHPSMVPVFSAIRASPLSPDLQR